MQISPLIAAAAGVASAVLFLAAVQGGALGLLTSLFLAPLPIAIIGMGWGWRTAMLAAAVAAGGLLVVAPLPATVIHLAAIGLPMTGFAYLLSLNRDVQVGNQTQTEWYPLGRVAGAIALWAAGISALAILATGTTLEGVRTALKGTIERFLEMQQGQLPAETASEMTPERIEQFTELMLQVLPAGTATIWTLIAVMNLYFGAKVAQQSGRLLRPWPDLSVMSVPRSLGLAFAVAAIVSFTGGIAGLIASCFVWAFAMCFVLQGLAIIHQITRGQSFRGLLLFATYLALIILNPFSAILVALIGLAEPISPLRRRVTEEMGNAPPPPGAGPPPGQST